MNSVLNVQFSDATEASISAYFSSPQSASSYPNLGTVATSDTRWSAFYNALSVSAQSSLPSPTAT